MGMHHRTLLMSLMSVRDARGVVPLQRCSWASCMACMRRWMAWAGQLLRAWVLLDAMYTPHATQQMQTVRLSFEINA